MSDLISAGSGFGTYETQDKILIGLSGGVDSSVCIEILKQQGFDVRAAVINFSPAHKAAVSAAVKIANQMQVPLSIEDCTHVFDEKIITPFCESYCKGVTPSPCVMCNPLIKFNALINAADRYDINLITSGHYARICEENGIFYIKKAYSEKKDQSYMLYRLPQDILKRLCLPIGEFEKDDIRQMAKDANLLSADVPDSQEICFIPSNDYAAFIKERGMQFPKGKFIGPNGEDLGEHKGVIYYTVGQRKGLGVAYGKPIFVKSILANGNIQLALSGNEYFSKITLTDIVKTDMLPYKTGMEFDAKIRSRATPAECEIVKICENSLEIKFTKPQKAPAPGQSVVFYTDDLVMGGGVIQNVE